MDIGAASLPLLTSAASCLLVVKMVYQMAKKMVAGLGATGCEGSLGLGASDGW